MFSLLLNFKFPYNVALTQFTHLLASSLVRKILFIVFYILTCIVYSIFKYFNTVRFFWNVHAYLVNILFKNKPFCCYCSVYYTVKRFKSFYAIVCMCINSNLKLGNIYTFSWFPINSICKFLLVPSLFIWLLLEFSTDLRLKTLIDLTFNQFFIVRCTLLPSLARLLCQVYFPSKTPLHLLALSTCKELLRVLEPE